MPTDQAAVTAADRRVALAVGAGAVAVVLWNVPFLGALLFPLRLLTTFAHEAGHGLTAVATGGHFARFEIAANGSGVALTAGGWRWLILPAGYLGSGVFAATLFAATHRTRRPGHVALAVSIALALTAVLFGFRSGLALVAGLGCAVALAGVSRVSRDGVVLVTLDVVAFVVAWNAVLDLVSILRQPSLGRGTILNDAAAFAEHVGFGGGRLWALLWLVLLTAILVTGSRIALRPRN